MILGIESLTIILGQGETSDFRVDGLKLWWMKGKEQFPNIKRLVIYLDNGPHNWSRRTQFLKRLVEFANEYEIEIHLVYYPPYHSKYNPVERCWGILEQRWNGTLLTSPEIMIEMASRMRWCGKAPTVEKIDKEYEHGVKVSGDDRKKYEQQIERLEKLPKYDVLIKPKAV